MTRGAAAILLGAALLAVALMTAVSVGSTGTGWGEGGALAMLRLPRVLAAATAGNAHGVGGVSRCFGRALAGLIAVAEVRVLHVEVTLARRDVHRLAGAAT